MITNAAFLRDIRISSNWFEGSEAQEINDFAEACLQLETTMNKNAGTFSINSTPGKSQMECFYS